MVITNTSNITSGALLTAANQLPFSLIVDSAQPVVAYISLYANGGYLVQNAEMLCYKRQSPFYHFTIDIRDIINTLFVNLDDELQAEWTWKNMQDWIYDVTLTYVVKDNINPDETGSITFTVLNSATQMNNDSRICDEDDNYYNMNQYEKIFVGEHNIGYAYVITALGDEVSTSQQEKSFFVDSDDIYFTSSDDDYEFEI